MAVAGGETLSPAERQKTIVLPLDEVEISLFGKEGRNPSRCAIDPIVFALGPGHNSLCKYLASVFGRSWVWN